MVDGPRINRRRHGTGTAGKRDRFANHYTKERKPNKIQTRRILICYTNKSRKPAAPPINARGIPTLPADPACTLDDVAVGVAMCDPTNGVFIFDALAVSVDADVVALDPSLAVVPAVADASDAADPVDAAVSVTAAAADSAFVLDDDDDPEVMVAVPAVSVAAAAAVAAESVTPVMDAAAVSVADAELLVFSAPLCVFSSAFAFGASEPPDSGSRPV